MRFTRLVPALMILVLPFIGFAALAQTARDVPTGHWSYEFVQDLATKGLIKGYPPDGNFFGGRTVTRYEMAALVDRILQRVEELIAKKADKGEKLPTPPAEGVLDTKQLDEVRRLVDEFKIQLGLIGTDLQKVKDDVGYLKQDVAQLKTDVGTLKGRVDKHDEDIKDVKQGVGAAVDAVHEQAGRIDKVNSTLNSHKISGFIQGRFESYDTGRTSIFTPTGAGGAGQSPGTGGPAVGGPWNGFQVRRARLKLTGNITERTDYGLQVDLPSSGGFRLFDAFVNVANIPSKGIDVTAGQYLNHFGFELPFSSGNREAPERSMAFSETTASSPVFKSSVSSTGGTVTPGSVVPLFLNQEFDQGIGLTWYPHPADKLNKEIPDDKKTKVQLSIINGEGSAVGGQRNLNNGLDLVGHAQTSFFNHRLGVGISGYQGSIPVRAGSPVGGVPVGFVNGVRSLAGIDLSYTTPWKTVIRGEYVGGVFETTPDRAQFLENNHVQGFYIQLKHPLTSKLDFVTKYEEYMPISEAGKLAGGLSRMELIRKAVHAGFLFQLDSATRFRLWYERGLTPYDPSISAGPLRDRLGFLTGEIQVKY